MHFFMHEIFEYKFVVNELLIADKPKFCHNSVKPFLLLSIVVPYTKNKNIWRVRTDVYYYS